MQAAAWHLLAAAGWIYARLARDSLGASPDMMVH